MVAIMPALGYLVARTVLTGRMPAVTLAVLPILGGGLLVIDLAALGAAHVTWTWPAMLAPWAVLGAIRIRAVARAVGSDVRLLQRALAGVSRGGAVTIGLGMAIAAVCLLSLLVQVALPLVGWDTIAFWLLKARVYYDHQSFSVGPFLGDPRRHPDYPPLFPGLVDVIYVLDGKVADDAGKAIDGAFMPLLAMIVTAAVRPLLGIRWALGFALLAITCPLLLPFTGSPAELGYADFALAVMLAAVIANLAALERGEQRAAAGALVAAALAALLKQEGLVAFLVVAAIVFTLPRVRAGLAGLEERALVVLAVATVAGWELYVRAAGAHTEFAGARLHTPFDAFDRLTVIARFSAQLLTSTPDFLWVCACTALIAAAWLTRRATPRLAAAAVAAQVAGYAVAYVLTSYDLDWQLRTSEDRLVIQVLPALILLLAMSLDRAPSQDPVHQSDLGYSTSR